MKNICSKPVAPASAPALNLLAVWDVNEGSSYDVRRHISDADQLIALRTWKGAGKVWFTNGGTMELRAGTVVVLPNREIARYHCLGPQWKFWWFEFTVVGVRHFPMKAILDVSRRAAEKRDFREVFVLLRRQAAAPRALAAALFSVLLHRWLEKAPGNVPRVRHEAVITRIIDHMSDHLETGWQISEMAGVAGMRERAFRNAFHGVTGSSPKVFYDRTRLAFAEELLKLGTHNVSEIAERLGYSSPFHFSKAFKQKYGVPPARWLRKGKAEG